jgi:hypothetical protein
VQAGAPLPIVDLETLPVSGYLTGKSGTSTQTQDNRCHRDLQFLDSALTLVPGPSEPVQTQYLDGEYVVKEWTAQ